MLSDNTSDNAILFMNFRKHGFQIKTNFLSTDKCKYLISEIEENINSGSNYGVRNIDKKVSAIAYLANSKYLLNCANSYLNGNAFLVRAIYFNKTLNTNWSITWHQDKTIAVNKKINLTQILVDDPRQSSGLSPARRPGRSAIQLISNAIQRFYIVK